MRLTLRTMLAYLDDILDPADAEDLGQKIEQSEFATGLVHRIRSATRRVRLGVPALDGKGMGLDPNTVAEYLDNELPPDRVPDFEKICLESDVHLAEVAACHQVLTLILGQPVDINPDVKRRMLAIGSVAAELAEQTAATAAAASPHPVRHDAAHAASSPLATATGAQTSPVTLAKREAREVPEYLRAGRRSSLKTLAMAMVVAFLGCVLVLRAWGPFDGRHPLARLFGATPQVAERPIDQPEPGDLTAPEKPHETESQGAPQVGGATAEKPGGAELTPGRTSDQTRAEDFATGQAKPGELAPAKPIEPPPPEVTPTGKGAAKVPVDNAPPEKPEAKLAGKPAVAGATPEAMQGDEPETPAAKEDGIGLPPPKPDEPAHPAPGASEAVVVGQLKPTTPPTPPQVLLALNPQTGEWLRLAPPARLVSGLQLLVPPTFSPEIVLSRGVQVGFAGPSLVRPMTTSVTDEVGLGVSYCRAFLYTAGVAGARIHLDLAGRRGVATFVDPTSELALEVKRYLPPGANPEQDPVQIVIQLFTTVGRILWEDAVSGAAPIDQGQVHMIVADRAQTVASGELPAWVRRDGLTNVDRMAAAALESFLSMDRPVTLSLKERSKDRKSEVRALAARSLAYLDFNDAAVLELADEQQRPFWAAEFDALRESICRSPESAVRVRETLERLCGEEAPKLYRMLWGFSPQQLQGRDAEQLVAYLDQDSLYVRVVAFENLRRITKKTLLYRPEANKSRRKSSCRSWQDQLQNGGIVYAILPSPTLPVD